MYYQKVYKNGNSLVITIPKQICRDLNIRAGTIVVVTSKNGVIYITPKRKIK